MAASAHEFEAKMNDGSMRSMTEYKEWFENKSDSFWIEPVDPKMGPWWSGVSFETKSRVTQLS